MAIVTLKKERGKMYIDHACGARLGRIIEDSDGGHLFDNMVNTFWSVEMLQGVADIIKELDK